MAVIHRRSRGGFKKLAFLPGLIFVFLAGGILYFFPSVFELFTPDDGMHIFVIVVLVSTLVFYLLFRGSWFFKKTNEAQVLGKSGTYTFLKEFNEISDEYHVFQNVYLKNEKETIDYVVLSKMGVCAVEVKYHVAGDHGDMQADEIAQTAEKSEKLHKALRAAGLQIEWVQGLLVRADLERMSEMHQGSVDQIGHSTLPWYFTEYVPMAHMKKIHQEEEELSAYIKVLETFMRRSA